MHDGLSRRHVVAGLGALPLLGLGIGEAAAQVPAPTGGPDALAPADGWLPIDPAKPLERIGFGSCLDQKMPQPIWKSVLAQQPDLFLMIGDNVYGDIKSPDLAELIEAYRLQARHPEFAEARAAFPFLATWDDHDYGVNDGGGSFQYRARSADLFRAFWQMDVRQPDGGIYHSRIIGSETRRVQIIMLDTRSFRSDFKRKGPDFPYWGRYMPDPSAGRTILGETQWSWLAGELRRPAEVRLLVSSIQVLAEGHGFERWGNLPRERQRLVDLLNETAANGVVLLSGDRHAGAMYKLEGGTRYPVYELTASSLNRSYGPSKDERVPPLISGIYHPENFGLATIDWEKRLLKLALHGMDGVVVTQQKLPFTALGTA